MNRRRFLAAVGATTSAAAAVGTGAFSVARLTDRGATIAVVNDADGLVGLVPNPRVAGVRTTDGGELTIALSDPGINADSVYQFGYVTPDWDHEIDAASFPMTVPEGADPTAVDEDGAFESGFLVRNHSSTAKAVRMTFGTEDGSTLGDATFLFQAHYDGAEADRIVVENDDDPELDVVLEALAPTDAIGVSLLVDAREGAPGDGFSGTLTVSASDAGAEQE